MILIQVTVVCFHFRQCSSNRLFTEIV